MPTPIDPRKEALEALLLELEQQEFLAYPTQGAVDRIYAWAQRAFASQSKPQ